MKEKMRIELASTEALKFVQKLAERFLDEVLNHPEALITNESKRRDFSSFDTEDAVGPGSRPGTFIFRYRVVRKGRAPWKPDWHKDDPENYEEREIETEASLWRQEVVQRTKDIFGVDISAVLDKPLPEVFQFIARSLPQESRKEQKS